MSNTGKPTDPSMQPDSAAKEAQSLASDVLHKATDTASSFVKDKTSSFVDEQKAAAAGEVEEVARVLDEVSGHVPVVGSYIREAASGIHTISSSLRDRSIDEMLDDFGRFAARRPAALIGASIIGGFALARFLKSSADRHADRQRNSGRARAEQSGSSARSGSAGGGGTASRETRSDRSAASQADLDRVPSPVSGMSAPSPRDRTSGPASPGATPGQSAARRT